MSDRAFAYKIDKEELVRDIMRHGNISIKDASIILGMRTSDSFRVKLCRGSFSLEDIVLLGKAAGMYTMIRDNTTFICVNDYGYDSAIEANLIKWKDCKKEVIDDEIRRLQALRDSL